MLGRIFLRKKQAENKKSILLQIEIGKQLAERILQIQIIVVLLTSLVVWFVSDYINGIAAAWGGFSAIVSFRIFARLAFSISGARMAQLTVRAFYLGEALKLVTGLTLLVVGLAILRLQAEPLLLSFVLTLVPVWFGPLFLKTRKN